MYCLIITQPMKRKPPRSRAYRNARCVPAYPGAGYCSIKGEEIERTLKEKYRVVLKESHRIDGRIKTKQWHIITLSYWDIIDDFMLYHKSPDDDVLWIWEGSIEDKVRKHFPNATAHQFQEYCQLISDKLTPIKDGIILEYLHSEEYHVRLENERMKEHYNRQHRKKERQNSSQTGYTYHSFQFGPNPQALTDAERELAQQIIQAGYRKLAPKYHPDAGGNTSTMQQLNLLKEKLLHLL